MQPVVGAIADKSTSKWGRRKPFMVIGSLIVGVCLLLLGWTSELVSLFVPPGDTQTDLTILVAILAIYAVDFAINAVQACCRSLIVDTLPISQQQQGSAWAARMSASGHVVAYFIGTFDLVAIFPNWLGGDTQFKKMCFVSTVGLWVAVGITSWAVAERRLLSSSAEDLGKGVFSVLPALWRRTINLPPRIQAICWCQFWGWIGWFPFLFYSSTWVGETYYRYEHPATENDDHDALGNIGRLGSMSLVIFSLITFTSSVLLPYLVKNVEEGVKGEKFTLRPPPSISKSIQGVLVKAAHMQPDLVTAWIISNLSFAAIMFWAPFIRSVGGATLLVALCGIPWAVSCWAPFAEMGREINRMSTSGSHSVRVSNVPGYTAVRASIDETEDDNFEMGGRVVSDGVLRLQHDEDEEGAGVGELAGVYLGVLNVYTTLPQFVGTFVSWVVFSILEPSRNDAEEGGAAHEKWLSLKKNAPNAIAVCLFIGACCAVVGAEATRRLRQIP